MKTWNALMLLPQIPKSACVSPNRTRKAWAVIMVIIAIIKFAGTQPFILCCTRRCRSMMITVKKAHGLCKVSFKMRFIIANSIRREWYRRSYVPLAGGNHRWCSIKWAFGPHVSFWRGFIPPCQSLELLQDFLTRNNSIHHFHCQTERMFTWELAATHLDNGKDMREA